MWSFFPTESTLGCMESIYVHNIAVSFYSSDFFFCLSLSLPLKLFVVASFIYTAYLCIKQHYINIRNYPVCGSISRSVGLVNWLYTTSEMCRHYNSTETVSETLVTAEDREFELGKIAHLYGSNRKKLHRRERKTHAQK